LKNVINSIRPAKGGEHNSPSLLDIGCAYGPVLVEASHFGYLPQGVEIIPEAADYIRSEFGFRVFTGAFENSVFEHQFDVVTMWYVIEHFKDPDYILIRVNKLLKQDGIFSFSTPNSSGISARKKMSSFLMKSPLDHITIWNPKISARVLSRYGFKIKNISITGHHAERFSRFLGKNFYLLNKIFDLISKLFKLGDTFEVYAQKIKEIDD
jgi:2-polyprenyl-3-methyl-5-hydroxy-6-metoxy-1,4-benzoquinol methylase